MYENINYKQILKRDLKIYFYTFHFLSSFQNKISKFIRNELRFNGN